MSKSCRRKRSLVPTHLDAFQPPDVQVGQLAKQGRRKVQIPHGAPRAAILHRHVDRLARVRRADLFAADRVQVRVRRRARVRVVQEVRDGDDRRVVRRDRAARSEAWSEPCWSPTGKYQFSPVRDRDRAEAMGSREMY